MTMLIRSQKKIDGFDCILDACPHDPRCPKGEGGRDGGRYIYALTNREGTMALTLVLFAGDYPEVTPPKLRLPEQHRERLTGQLSLHVARPRSEDGLTATSQGCDYLKAGRCYDGGTSYLAVDEFLPLVTRREDGFIAYEQPDAFWLRLTQFAREWMPRAQKDMDETAQWITCPRCKGHGKVKMGRKV